jgi:hypothetical protein
MIYIICILLFACNDKNDLPPEPLTSGRFKCTSKDSGSTPECWNENDWKEFCKRVECKNTGELNDNKIKE